MREKDLERTLKAIANKRRVAILQLLKKKKRMFVGEIADAISLSFKATSKHLNILFAVDFVEREQVSLQMYYQLASEQSKLIKTLLSVL